MAATISPGLAEKMLAALHGAEGEWGAPAELLPVALRLDSPGDLQPVASALLEWGGQVVRSAPRAPTIEALLPAGRLWDLLGLEGVEEVREGEAAGRKPRRVFWLAALGAGLLLAGLFLGRTAIKGPSAVKTDLQGVARYGAAPSDSSLPGRGEVEAILAGDSLRLVSGQMVRLAGLDAPAYQNPERGDEIFGQEAHQALSEMAKGKPVRLEYPPGPQPADGYLTAYVYLSNGTDINAALLREGAAQFDFATAGDEHRATYSRLEVEARREKRGLWGGPVVGNRSSQVYHLPGGQFYLRVNPANRVLFATEEEARAAGYRPSSR